jgi:alanine racemase
VTTRRWAWVEVDAQAVSRNVRSLTKILSGGCAMMAVVKADGYGHGAETMARAALDGGATRLGVATVDEALALRESGVTAPMLVMAETPADAVEDLVRDDIAVAVASGSLARTLSAAAERIGKPARFHLKVDTGMHRLGVAPDEAAEFLTSLRGLPGIGLEGVFTHFATAEVPGDWDFERQLERFDDALAGIRQAGFEPGIVHAANSAAAILHPGSHFDMVRCGISIYGLHPGEATRQRVELRPAMSVRARVAAVRRVAMGEGVSYGLTWRAAAPTDVATIPLGYADGVHRVLSERMRVLISGRACPQVGRVCMDQLMVEIPRGMRVDPGDPVTVVGRQDEEDISMDELAQAAGTINYEMACAFGMRMDRVSI